MTITDDTDAALDLALTEQDRDLSDLIARYRIGGDGEATWAMRKALAAKERMAEVERIAAAEVERIQSWAEQECAGPGREYAFFARLLTDYALHLRSQDPKRKSVSTPYGKVQTRTQQVGWTVDEDVFLAWARDNRPELIRTTEKPALSEAKKALTADEAALIVVDSDGVPVPGIILTPASVTASVVVAP